MRVLGAKTLAGMLMTGLAIALVAPSASAQQKSDGYKFLEAVRQRDGNVATELLSEPGNTLVNARDITSGESALHVVTARRDITWVRYLLSKGARADIADRRGVTPLQVAVQVGFAEGVEALLAAGANVEIADDAGETPLMSAIHRRDITMVRLLLGRGANPDKSDNSGRTARDYARLLGASSPMLGELERAEKEKAAKSSAYGPG